ncbi:MAG: WGR domain-containing protein [Cyanobacteria bacterium J06576_12]
MVADSGKEETGSRHYSCEVKQNLFGQWIVLRRWGRVSAFQGQSLEQVCDQYQE